MSKKLTKYSIFALLVISLVGNIGLYFWGKHWKNALVNQFIATSDIEQIFLSTEADVTFENVHKIAKAKFGESVVIVDIGMTYTNWNIDSKAIGINDTLLIFKNGKYFGSKSFVR